MPTYRYECGRCKHTFELFQSIRSDTTAICPKCRGKAKRLIGSGAGIIFKGSGFYATDYKKKAGDDKKPPCPMSKECGKGCGMSKE